MMNDSSSQENDDVVIKVDDLYTVIGGNQVHRGIGFEVKRGELMTVIGASGAGKTVLLDQVIGLRRPDRGSIRVFGKAFDQLSAWEARQLRRRWGVLFQQAALFSAMTVYDNLAFPVRELRQEGIHVDEDELRANVALKLHMVGLAPDDAWKYPHELSGGMAKRAALARALMLEAELLFLDEPTSGLDPASASELDSLIGELHEELGLTALMVTHDAYSVTALSDRVGVLADGKLVAVGSVQEVIGVDHPFIANFFHPRHGEEQLRTLISEGSG
jgi:phospholipid/cholesterol/gamma-HCH transport system ATP-binding protein